jgi:hypothetical protein
VAASTVAASGTTMVCSILAPYIFHGQVPADIQGLVESAITAAVTFGAGYFARHVVPAVEHDAEQLLTRAVAKPVAPAPAPVVVPPVGG